MSDVQMVGGGVVVLAVLLILGLGSIRSWMKNLTLRHIPAISRLKQSVGMTIEDGKRLHISPGTASILGTGNAASLAGLSTIEQLALLSMVSDRPPVITSGEGSLAVLSQDVLRYAYRQGNALGKYDPFQARLSGVTPFSFAVGTRSVITHEIVQSNVLVGRFGPEAAFINDAAFQKRIYCFGASDDLPGQAVMYATANDTLIGEELFAAPAYLGENPYHRASLLTQDIFRWILIATLLGGAVLAILQHFFGLTLL